MYTIEELIKERDELLSLLESVTYQLDDIRLLHDIQQALNKHKPPITLPTTHGYILCEQALFGELRPVVRRGRELIVFKLKAAVKKYKTKMHNPTLVILPVLLTGDKIVCTYDNRTYEMLLTDEQWKPKK